MTNEKRYIAFFDLDRTVLGMNSGYALGRSAYKAGLINRSDLINALFLALLYKLKLRSAEKMITGMGSWLRGLTIETVSPVEFTYGEQTLLQILTQDEMRARIGYEPINNTNIQ